MKSPTGRIVLRPYQTMAAQQAQSALIKFRKEHPEIAGIWNDENAKDLNSLETRAVKLVDHTAFEESQLMARMAVLRVQARVAPESYWAAAMACLMEAYGK